MDKEFITIYQTTRSCMPEDDNIYSERRENLKCHILIFDTLRTAEGEIPCQAGSWQESGPLRRVVRMRNSTGYQWSKHVLLLRV
jgi:hypothetical protein